MHGRVPVGEKKVILLFVLFVSVNLYRQFPDDEVNFPTVDNPPMAERKPTPF